MKDINREQIEKSRPQISAAQAINFCLDKMYAEKDKGISDIVVQGLSFEELIGALLLAKDLTDKKSKK